MESLGQNIEVWTNEWKGLTLESEIRMWDFYGLRPWVMKYTPRFGEVLEAGCGLGRYNFLLSHFGINISGLDFSKETINHLNKWQKKNGYKLKFLHGDIKKLPFKDNELSGYLSFGVIEHFEEGPKEVLDEVYRVLKPGGIAIITTPNKSWNVRGLNSKKKLKNIIKKLIGRRIIKKPFFQYEYSPRQLKKFMLESGLFPLEVKGGDYLYSFAEYGGYTGENIQSKSFAYRISPMLDKRIVNMFGAQSITITTKLGDRMQCFMCGNNEASIEGLKTFSVPLCNNCIESDTNCNYYLKNVRTYYHDSFEINPDIVEPINQNCDFCQKEFKTDKLFEYFGLNKIVCPDCLRNKHINIKLANEHLRPIWRRRI